jgi:hypothetical protein
MNLPPLALQALADLKRELLSRDDPAPARDDPRPMREEKPRKSHVMRRARMRSYHFQRACQGRRP